MPPTDASRTKRPAELVRAATAARMYFLESFSKSDNATELGISRFKVARILDDALASGLVRIEISTPRGIDTSLSARVRQISARNGGPAYPMYVPQVLPDAATAQAMRQQPEVAEAYRRFPSISKAIVAVGSWTPPNSQLYDSLTEPERRDILIQGAV